ncbi:cytochrome c biogenesis factor, partial [Longilinea arvoryzae]
PEQVTLPAPKNELEDMNACGPATLAMALRFWGWEGDQYTISDQIKPIRADRNVNVEELKYYVDNFVPGMYAEFRVGGDLDLLRRFLADGIPVMIEESFKLDKAFIVEDDFWAGHYVLLTGYDDKTQEFITQDSEKGANRRVAYTTTEEYWQSFNHVYILIYPPDKQNNVLNQLGAQFDVDANRQYALDQAKAVTVSDPTNAFAWFNLGTNLMYFQRYEESVAAYDQARDLGLPKRMLRYQFGPFISYFNMGRIDDLSALADYALKITPNSEEALLWKGWALYRQGNREEALASFQKALDAHPNYGDAQYAINYVYNN